MIRWLPLPSPRSGRPCPAAGAPSVDAAEERLAALRHEAVGIGESAPRWHVYASAGLLALVAIPLWDPGTTLVLTSPDPAELFTQIREVEDRAGIRPPSRRGGAAPTPSRLRRRGSQVPRYGR